MRSMTYVVEAVKGEQLQYWAAATDPENAARAVRQYIGEDWHTRLTDHVLDKDYAASLELTPGRVRRIKYTDGIFVTERSLFLVSANKSRIGTLNWSDDDYDVRYGSKQGPVIGRIYKKTFSPNDRPWFWAVNCFVPAQAADTGDAATREDAMAELKARWIDWGSSPSKTVYLLR